MTPIEQAITQGVFKLFVLVPDTFEWATANYEIGCSIKEAGGHHEAIPYLLHDARYHTSIAKLEYIVQQLHNDARKAEVLKEGLEWPHTSTNDWCKWRYYDDLSVCAYYNNGLKEAQKAYALLIKYKEYPASDADRILNNAQFYESADTDTSLTDLEIQLKNVALTIVVERYFHHVPSLAHFIYLRGMEFGMHHYIALASAAHVMKWNKILLYNDRAPADDNEWWKKALQLPNLQVITIVPPKFINGHKLSWKQHQADVIRLLVLQYMGGVYMDLDMLTYRSFKDELKVLEDTDKTIMLCREDQWKVANCIIGCLPNSPFINEWIRAYKAEYGLHEDKWSGLSVYKPQALIKDIPAHILPTYRFLPFDYFHTQYFLQSHSTIDFEVCYGVHLWDTEQQKRNILPSNPASFLRSNTRFAQMFGKYVSDQPTSSKCIIVAIEGNIGSGKSTLLHQLQSAKFALPHKVVQEDVKGWTSYTTSEGKNLIEYYYSCPERMSYCFQSMAMVSRISTLCEVIQTHPNHIIITERSHLTDAFVFAKLLYETKKMSEIEWLTYQRCYDQLVKLLAISVDIVVYNKASVDVCMNRIQLRKRKGEDAISQEYLSELDAKHEAWIQSTSTTVTTLDGDVEEDSFERAEQIQQLVSLIDDYIS